MSLWPVSNIQETVLSASLCNRIKVELLCYSFAKYSLHCTESVPRREEGSTGKYQHEVEGTPETECWYFPVLPDLSQGTDIIQFLKVMYTVLTEQYLMFYQGYFVRQIQFLSGPLGLRFITFINWIMSVP